MKVNVSVEATAQEMREFLGLPNVQPLHDEILQAMRKNVERGVVNLEALGMLKPLWPAQFHSMEMVQKFWEAVAKASGKPAKEAADLKSDDFSETPDRGEARNNIEKAA
ncbi:MAG TPA: DUF6489 family protein [Candidatus Contendobacter sp.]|jgi:hypothetical protein|nr:DUF6489 family protein [Candidatus Contendobacter sp.]HRZ24843.1 DUF6489 family protein [Candidatus Contendobacter sp.]HRZ51777.1 DUF6489 family protein [Candidatus Contendobacter sp.]